MCKNFGRILKAVNFNCLSDFYWLTADFYQPIFSNDYFSFGIGKYMISRRRLQILWCLSHFIFCLSFFSQKSKHFLILWGFWLVSCLQTWNQRELTAGKIGIYALVFWWTTKNVGARFFNCDLPFPHSAIVLSVCWSGRLRIY